MMRITVNGQAEQFKQAPTVAELLENLGLTGKRVAVEVNREIVPRSQHGEHQLAESDQVEIVHAIGGG